MNANDHTLDFEEYLVTAEALLESFTDINELIHSALLLANFLSNDYQIDQYIATHSAIISYFANFRKIISNREVFTEEKLDNAFRFSLACWNLLPRLYITFILACEIGKPEYISLLIRMFSGENHPLRGFLLRFTAITFFPRNSNLMLDFAVTNFVEMLHLLPRFLEAYPDSTSNASTWITSNISFSLFLSKSNPRLIKEFLDAAAECSVSDISVSIIDSIAQSLEPEQLPEFLDLIANFFSKIPEDSRIKETVLTICEKLTDCKTSFNFVIKTPYEKELQNDITNHVLECKDIEVLKLIAKQWPVDTVYRKMLETLGLELFAEVVDELPKGHMITSLSIRKVTPETKPESVRHILKNEMLDRNSELDFILFEMFERNSYSKEFIEIVFDDPFIVTYQPFLNYMIYNALRQHCDSHIMIGILDRAVEVDIANLYCLVYEPENGDELITKLLDKYEIWRKNWFMHIVEMQFGEESAKKILERLFNFEDIVMFAQLCFTKQFNDLAMDAVYKALQLDDKITHYNTIFQNYINIFNCLIGEKYEQIPNSQQFFQDFITHLINFLEAVQNKYYPLALPDQINQWTYILTYAKRIECLSPYEQELDQIISLFQS